jgi:hypothetical protein
MNDSVGSFRNAVVAGSDRVVAAPGEGGVATMRSNDRASELTSMVKLPMNQVRMKIRHASQRTKVSFYKKNTEIERMKQAYGSQRLSFFPSIRDFCRPNLVSPSAKEAVNYRYDKNLGTIYDKYNAQEIHLRKLADFKQSI